MRDAAGGVVGGDLGGRDDVDDHRPGGGQARDRIRPVCSAAFMGREATRRAAPRKRTGGHKRGGNGGPVVQGSGCRARPYAQPVGLYDPALRARRLRRGLPRAARRPPAHETISRAIETLDNLEHRGAEGADAETGDGAGILTQIPDAFLRAECDFGCRAAGAYAVGRLLPPARRRPPRRVRDA